MSDSHNLTRDNLYSPEEISTTEDHLHYYLRNAPKNTPRHNCQLQENTPQLHYIQGVSYIDHSRIHQIHNLWRFRILLRNKPRTQNHDKQLAAVVVVVVAYTLPQWQYTPCHTVPHRTHRESCILSDFDMLRERQET